ncbi:MAG: hypothetical protein K2P93_06035 [Alphaproteobacteria bacterium]|nr:hypothetical protein [Alphaproteobacteria bacterium]
MRSFKRVLAFLIAVGFVHGGEAYARKQKPEGTSASRKLARSVPRLKSVAPETKHDLKIENLPNGKVKITESEQITTRGRKKGDFSYSSSSSTGTYSAQHATNAIARAKARAAKAEKDQTSPAHPKKDEAKVSQLKSLTKKSTAGLRKRREAVKNRIHQKKPAVQNATDKTKEKTRETRKRAERNVRKVQVKARPKLKEVKGRVVDRRSLKKKKTKLALEKSIRAKKTSASVRNPKKGPSAKKASPTTKKIFADKKNASAAKRRINTLNTKRVSPPVKKPNKSTAKKNGSSKPTELKKVAAKRSTAVKKPGAKTYRIAVKDLPPDTKQLLTVMMKEGNYIGRDQEIPDNMILPPLSALQLKELLNNLSVWEALYPNVTQRTRNVLKTKYGFEG